MRVFISWSGERGNSLAEILRKWLPCVLQTLKPYYSPSDIAKGARWSSEVSSILSNSSIGIICLTPDALNSSWVMFEAGALSKNIGASKVCPILFGIKPMDVTGPLAQFQATNFSKSDIKQLMQMMNKECGELSLEASFFDSVFETYWPELEKPVMSVMSKAAETREPSESAERPDRELLGDVLALTRSLSERFNDFQQNNKPETRSISTDQMIALVDLGLDRDLFKIYYRITQYLEGDSEFSINIFIKETILDTNEKWDRFRSPFPLLHIPDLFTTYRKGGELLIKKLRYAIQADVTLEEKKDKVFDILVSSTVDMKKGVRELVRKYLEGEDIKEPLKGL